MEYDNRPPKIRQKQLVMLIGFPKSGTTSFTLLFNRLGFQSFHWKFPTSPQKKKGKFNWNHVGSVMKENKISDKPLLTGITSGPRRVTWDSRNIAITQMDVCLSDTNSYWPQITEYKRLYEENKDAIFILNKRDENKLVSSFERWGSWNLSMVHGRLDRRMFAWNPELFVNVSGSTSREKLRNLIGKHYNDVEAFFASKPDSKFISYHVGKDNINILKKYIDLTTGSKRWQPIIKLPHKGKNVKS